MSIDFVIFLGAVGKKGLFGKIKEKYEAHQEAAKQRKQEEEVEAVMVQIHGLNKIVSKCLKDIAAPFKYKPFPIGNILGAAARFTTNDGMPIVSYIMMQYVDHRMELGGKLYVYPVDFIFGSFVDRSVPLSVITKPILSYRVFIPFQTQPNLQFDAENIYRTGINWNPLTDSMNRDMRLISALTSVPNAGGVSFYKSFVTWKIEDKNKRDTECICQIIPCENLTYIGIRALVQSEHDKHIKNIIDGMRMIRGHILNLGHREPVTGQIARDWIRIPISLFQSGFYKPPNQVEEESKLRENLCEKCGAKLRFIEDSGKWMCDNCQIGYSSSILGIP